MKRVAIFVIGSALSLFIGVGPAAADNGPHMKGAGLIPDTCAACHRAHTAQAPYLLKEDQESLCYTCHGSSGTGSSLDVADGVGYSEHTRDPGKTAGALRGGGFKYALIDSGNPSATGSFTTETVEVPVRSTGAPVTSAHTVDGSAQTAWGNGAISATPNAGNTISLTCGSCHDPHGNGNYRILRPVPVESGLSKTETGVEIPDVATKQYTTANYGKFAEPNNPAFFENISKWCSTCHTRYLAPSGSYKTNSGDAIFAYRHTTEYLSHRPQCITCHVAHGSNANMTGRTQEVTLPNGNLPSDTADSRLLRIDNRGVCQTCHRK